MCGTPAICQLVLTVASEMCCFKPSYWDNSLFAVLNIKGISFFQLALFFWFA